MFKEKKAVEKVEKKVEKKRVPCLKCNGSGMEAEEVVCSKCKGSGNE